MNDQEMRKSWSKEQQDYTRKILEQVDPVAFLFSAGRVSQGCCFNHLGGQYGYMAVQDALNCRYRWFDIQSHILPASYDTVDDLIAGGWKVST